MAMNSKPFDQRIFKRYAVKCYCGDYSPYKDTLKPGGIYAMLMRPEECVTCRGNDIKKQIK